MRVRFARFLVVVMVPAALVAQAPLAVGRLKISQPKTIAELDMDDLKGEPSRLAWSVDGSELYVQTIEGGFGKPTAKLRHYVYSSSTGDRRDETAELGWARDYWAMKSNQASWDTPDLKIDLKSTQSIKRATSVPMGGDLARGGVSGDTGTSSSGASTSDAAAAYGNQLVTTHTMRLGNEVVGEFINSVIVPGLTFGWGPPGTKVIAHTAQKNGRVVIMNTDGKKQEVDGIKDAILPAWSRDGTRLAWLRRDGRKKFILQVAQIGR